MKISINNITLAKGHKLRESPEHLSISENRSVQTISFLRGDNSQTLDRGNLKTDVSFSVTRQHTSEEDAAAFIVEHAAMSGLSGKLEMETEKKTYIIEQACVTQISSKLLGNATEHSYSIIGGPLKEA